MDKQGIFVAMPAMNEAGRIGPVIRSVQETLPGARVIVVNDGSTDGTQQEALDACAIVLPHVVNMGYGASLETAYVYAVRQGARLLVQMDSDGQHPAAELPRLAAPILDGSADIVLGSRYAAGGGSARTPAIRRAGQLFFGLLLRILTGRRFTDPTSGFQALGPRAIRFFSSGVFPCDYPDADVLLMAHWSGLRIREIPVQMLERAGGASMHAGWKPVYYGMKMLLSLFVVVLNYGCWRRWRARLQTKGSGCQGSGEPLARSLS